MERAFGPDLALDLRYLNSALCVAEHGSIRRAAAFLNLSQSTLSRRVQLLERRLGTTIFDRTHAGARPTAAGANFMREAAISASHLRQAIDEIAAEEKKSGGVLRIGLSVPLLDRALSALIENYCGRYRSVDIRFEEETSLKAAASVQRGRLDTAFVAGHPQLSGCNTVSLWKRQLYVVMPQGHILANLKEIDLREVQHETFLVTEDETGPELEAFLRNRIGVAGYPLRLSRQRVGRDNLLSMVAQGFGVALVDSKACEARYPKVIFQPLGGVSNVLPFSIVWRQESTNRALCHLLHLIGLSSNAEDCELADVDQALKEPSSLVYPGHGRCR